MRSECYKSDLRHALSFAAIWQNCGCAGKGFPAVARVSFPFRIRDPGLYLQTLDRKGAIIERAWHRHGECLCRTQKVCTPLRCCSPQKSEYRGSSLVIRVQQRRVSGPARSSLSTLILEEAFMRTWLQNAWSNCSSLFLQRCVKFAAAGTISFLAAAGAMARPPSEAGGEANLKLPELSSVRFFGGAIDGHKLLLWGILICILGLIFGLTIYSRLKNMPVHRSMREVSELIYETCKTYLITQGKFILVPEVFLPRVIVLYFGVLLKYDFACVAIILLFSLVGIGGSYGVAWFGIRVNTFANSRTRS